MAGGGAGLKGERSGTFYPFWDVITGLIDDNRAPKIVAIENVCGTLTSHGGRDFEAICKTFADAGYRYGPLIVNASLFLPQSRPRLFVIGVRDDVTIDPALLSPEPIEPFHTRGLRRAVEGVSPPAPGRTCSGGIYRRRRIARILSPISSKKILRVSNGIPPLKPSKFCEDVAGQQAKVEAAKRSGVGWWAGSISAPASTKMASRSKGRKFGLTMLRDVCGRPQAAQADRRLLSSMEQDSFAPDFFAGDRPINGT